ncbi:hypothetical protein GALMADRAFT_225964 [Galerina marginata CBS 339.88]|uniref:Cytoplasmic tRNA 2-thiolation protein 2 n=1 Tax=Galerina marginata (strain CBS 339.88) TaxID=685588 RepID=A0A067SZF7_GALM3|nr:hypothetical protein GALMADRAFT_225964 [Galerina marginata CBS 339.88]
MSSCENPNVDKDVLMTRRQKFDGKTKICVKCKENTGNVVIRYAVYCKSCFFPLIQTRFRKSLEPSVNAIPDGPRRKALKASGSILIGLSGGTSSTAMLDLVAKTYFSPRSDEDTDGKLKGGKEHPRNADKGVWKGKPGVCYVEVCGAFPGQKDRTNEIRATVETYSDSNFDFIPIRLEDSFDPNWWRNVGGGDLAVSARSLGLNLSDGDLFLNNSTPESSPLASLKAYLSSLPTQTAFFSAIQILIRLLLLHTAASRSASHLVLGTSLTSLSVNLISGIAQGAGFAVGEEAKEEWSPRPKRGVTVRVIRPLRDVGMKECAIWDWWCGLRVVGDSRSLNDGGRTAIGALTRDFIFGLESDYPATVSTVARTCAKLTPKEGSDGICALCERPAQHGVQAWKARISIRSYQEASSAVSGNTRPPHLTEEEIANLTNPSLAAASTSVPSPSLTPRLCYACHTLLTSRSSRGTATSLPVGQSVDSVPLPFWVRSTVDPATRHDGHESEAEVMRSTKMSRTAMKGQISEFLLPDE